MAQLELATLRSAGGVVRHFFSFDAQHFVEVERPIDARDPEDVKRVRFIWRPRRSAGFALMSVLTTDRAWLEGEGASFASVSV